MHTGYIISAYKWLLDLQFCLHTALALEIRKPIKRLRKLKAVTRIPSPFATTGESNNEELQKNFYQQDQVTSPIFI